MTQVCENVHEQRLRRIVFSSFFFRRWLPELFFSYSNVIETNFLRASPTPEFLHSLDPKRKSRLLTNGLPRARKRR
jgi:hypothetical protein